MGNKGSSPRFGPVDLGPKWRSWLAVLPNGGDGKSVPVAILETKIGPVRKRATLGASGDLGSSGRDGKESLSELGSRG